MTIQPKVWENSETTFQQTYLYGRPSWFNMFIVQHQHVWFGQYVGYSIAKQPLKDRCTILILALQRGSFYTCWDNFALNFPFVDGQSNVQTCQNMSKHQKMEGYPPIPVTCQDVLLQCKKKHITAIVGPTHSKFGLHPIFSYH